MKWIKYTERKPAKHKVYLFRFRKLLDVLFYYNNDTERALDLLADGYEWLDESEPSYTLEDMKSAFKAGGIYGLNNANKSFEDWLEQAKEIKL